MAFEGWWGSGGNGGFYQNLDASKASGETNVIYYFRIRALVEAQYSDRDFRQKIEFLDGSWNAVGGLTNVVNSTSWGDSTWTTISMCATGASGAARVRVVWETTNAPVVGWGSQAAKADRVMVWDKTLRYRPGETVEEFAFDPDETNRLDGKNLGNGWSGAWSESTADSFQIADFSFSHTANYPTNRGNKVKVEPPNDTGRYASRSFTAITTGTVYAAYYLNFTYNGANKYAGLAMLHGSTEKLFFGEIYAADLTLGIGVTSSAGTASSYALNNGGGNDYLIVGKYDFATRKAYVKAYNISSQYPTFTEPTTTWDLTNDISAGVITQIDGIRLTAGAGASSGTPGLTYFDEIRVARSWHELLNGTPTGAWDGNGATRNWGDATNWVGNVVPAAGTNATFYDAINNGTNINVDAAMTNFGIRFNDTADTALNITNNSLTINAGGIAASSGAAGNHRIASPIVLGANQSWTNAANTDITLSGVISGSGSVTKMGNSDGRFILSGNNTFTNTMTITQGRVLITHANALGGTGGGTIVQSGPSLQISGGITTAAEPLTLYGNGYWGGGALDSVSGNNTWAGPITLGASVYIRAQADTLTLSSATAISGSGYNIQFEGGGTIVVNSGIGTGAGAVTKIDNGTLVLNGGNTYSGATTLSAGTLIHNGTNTGSAVSVASGSTLMGVGSVGALTVTGTVRPGTNTTGIGRLAVTNLTMNNGSSYYVQLGNITDTSDRDYIQNSGPATINATVTVYLNDDLVSNWDSSTTRSWNIIVGGITSTNGITLNTTGWDTGTYPLNSGTWGLSASGNNLVLTFTACTAPAAPTGLYANPTNTTSFTANWSASSGATNYYIDVSTNATFGNVTAGGASTNCYHSGTIGAGTGGTWDDSTTFQASGYMVLYTTDVVVTPAMDLTVSTSETLSFRSRTYGGVNSNNNTITVSVSTNNGSTWAVMGTRTPLNTTMTAMTPFDLSAYNHTQVKVKFEALLATASVGAGIDDILITNMLTGATVPYYIPGYSNRTVGAGTSVSVTGLTQSFTYYYRLRAEGPCGISGNSTTQSVTTLAPSASYTLRYSGFEGTTNDNWSWIPSSTSVTLGPRANTNHTGSYSLMISGSQAGNVDPYILFDNVNLPAGSANIQVSVSYAASGADSGDDLYLEASYDNGATWPVSTQLVDGFNNQTVNFGETIVDRTASSNPGVISLVNNTTNVRIRIRYDEAAGNDNRYDEFYVDELKLTANTDGMKTVKFSATETVKVETNTTAFNIAVTISSAADATVRVAIAGTAQAGGTDFTATSTNLVFTAGGSTTANLEITLVDDSTAEGPESVRFTLTQAAGCRVVGPDVHTLFIRDDEAFSIVSANLANGTVEVGGALAWGDSGQRLLKTLAPDIVAVQEWVITNASYRAFVDLNFGTDYSFYVEPESEGFPIPNGVISRWPIVASNEWTDGSGTGSRDYVHVEVDLPGAANLNLVSVHFKADDAEYATREAQAREVTNYIVSAGFDAIDYLVIAGDLNLSNRSEMALTVLTNYLVTDASKPTTKAGSENTNPGDTRPYDFVLPDSDLQALAETVNYNGSAFADGMLFDTREWGDHQYPALGYDSRATNLTHRPVVKVFALGEAVEDPAEFYISATNVTQIDLTFETNASGDNIVIVYDTDGTFSSPSGSPPAVGNAFAGGTVIYLGTGSSYSHTGLDSCSPYYYKAWSYNGTPTFSAGLTDDATTLTPAAPTGLYASTTNATDFTATWSAATGASGYRLDVSTNATFGGGGSGPNTNLVEFDFASYAGSEGRGTSTVVAANMTSPVYITRGAGLTASANGGRFNAQGWGETSAANALANGDYFEWTLEPSGGYSMSITNITFNLQRSNTGASNVVLRASHDSYTADLAFSYNFAGDSATVTINTNMSAIAGLQNVSGSITFRLLGYTGASGGSLGFEGTGNDLVVQGYASSGLPSYIPGYSNRAVAATSQSVTGLTEGVTYYFRVRSEGDGGCTSGNSTTQSVVAAGAPEPGIIVLGTNLTAIVDGDTEAERADGTDFGYVAVVGVTNVHTFTITNSGTAALMITNFAIGGAHASDFPIVEYPSFVVASNLLTNPQFEEGLTGYTSWGGQDIRQDYNGLYPRRGTNFVRQWWQSGSYQDVTVTVGRAYTLSAWVATPTNDTMWGGALGYVKIEWRDKSSGDSEVGAAVERTFSTSGAHNVTITAGEWKHVLLPATNAPAGATHARVVIGMWTSDGGVTMFDDLVLYEGNGAGGSTTFRVGFDPSTVGTRTATVFITNNVSDKTTYDFALKGTGTWVGIGVSPAAFATNTMVGVNPGNFAFGVTNVGIGTLNYAVTTGYSAGATGWATNSPGTGSLGTGAGQQHTVTFGVLGMSAGTYYVTNWITDEAASNSPQSVIITLTLTNIPNPTAAAATGDGKEFVRLSWTKQSAYDVMIVHRAGAASTAPSQGTSYSAGGACGGGTVIYKGGGSYLDHVVSDGQTHHYAFYSYTANNHYSTGIAHSVTLTSYESTEIVEPFAYTNGISLGSLNGGNGWTNAWSVGGGTWTVQTNGENCTFVSMPDYPSIAAQRVKLTNPGDGGSASATRSFAAVNSGTIYASVIMAYNWEGADKWAGLSFMNSGVETGFVGKASGANWYTLGIASYGGATTWSSYDFRGLENSTNNTYLLIARYNFSTRELSTKAYYRTNAVPLNEPASWDATVTVPGSGIAQVNGVRLSGGGGTGVAVGDCYFDELRVASSWVGLLNATQPYATNYTVNTSNYVSDAQVTGGVFNVTMYLNHPYGMVITNGGSMFSPNFDLWNPSGIQIVTDEVFSAFTFLGATSLQASDASHAGYWPGTLGTYTSRWSAISSNGISAIDSTTLSNGTTMTFTVYDDDTNAPLYVAASNLLQSGGFELGGGIWTQGWWGTAWFSPQAAESGNFGAYVWNDDSGIDQWVNVSENTTYTLSVRARHNGSLTQPMLMKQENWAGGAAYTSATETNMQLTMTSSFQTYTLTFTTPAGTLSNKIVLFSTASGGSGMTYLDHILLQKDISARADPVYAKIGTTNYYPTRSDSNAIATVTDGDLREVSVANPFRLFLVGHDIESGLSRDTTDALSQMNVDIGSWVTDNVANYYATESSAHAGTFALGASNVWRWTNFSSGDVDTLFGTNKVTASIPDADNDRNDDRMWLINHQAGYLAVVDDDLDYPVAAWNNLITNGSFNGNGAGWTTYGGGHLGYDQWAAESGNWGLWMREDSQIGAYMQGPAAVGRVYTFSVRARKQAGFAPVSCYIKTECIDIGDNNIHQNEINIVGQLTTEWQTFSVSVTSIANTVYARGVMGTWNNPMTGTDYVMFDNANLADAGPLKVMIGGTAVTGSDSTSNAIFYVNSLQLTNITAANPFRLIFGAYDVGSGLSRDVDNAASQCHVSIGTAVQTNNAQYYATESSAFASTFAGGASNVWRWTNFSAGEISTMISAVTNPIVMTIRDADNDRTGDRISSSNILFGYLVVTSPPVAGGIIIYDGFDGTPPNTLSGGSGGTGWGTNVWVLGGDPYANYEAGSFGTGYSSYFDPTGQKIVMYGDVDGYNVTATRAFSNAFTMGCVYFSWIQNYEINGSGRWAGLKLMDGTTELAFIGKVSGADKALGIDSSSDNRTAAYELNNGSGNDYVIAGKYDFATRELSAAAYRITSDGNCEMVAEEPRGYWHVVTTQAVGHITSISGVRFDIGADSAQVGDVYVDEVRVGTNWFEVTRKDGLAQSGDMGRGPLPRLIYVGTNYTVGATNNLTITDGELADISNPLDFAVMWTNAYGVFMTNVNGSMNIGSRAGRVNPNWDPVRKAGEDAAEIGYDAFFTNFVGYNGALAVTTYVHAAFNITNAIVGDTFYITMSAENNNTGGGTITAPNGADAVPVWRAITVNSNVQFFVDDDDEDEPVSGNLLQNPGFEEQDGADANDALHWWRYEDSGRNDWAERSGDQGMAWWSWLVSYGGFGQDVYVDLDNGDVVTFTIWGLAETGFVSSASEANIILEFWTGGTMDYAVTNSIYAQLVGNYNTWTEHRFTYTNTVNGVNLVKPILSGGNWLGYGTGAVMFDDATLTKGTYPLRVYVGGSDKTDSEPGVSVHTVTDADLAGLAANPLRLIVEGYDLSSGLQRGTTDAARDTILHVANLTTNDGSHYWSDGSSANTRTGGSTNTWRWTSALSSGEIQALMDGGSNEVLITARDGDVDRTGDQGILSNRLAGFLRVIDDDTVKPLIESGSNMLVNAGFEIGDGVNIPNWNPWEHAYAVGRAAYAGTNGVEFTSPGWGNIWQGVPGSPSNWYEMSYYVRRTSVPTVDMDIVYLKVEFHDVDLPFTNLITSYETNIVASLTTEWQLFTFGAWAVDGTKQVRASIGAGEWHGGSQVTTVHVDSITLTESPPPMHVSIGGTAYPITHGAWTNASYTVTDGALAGVSGGNPLHLSIRAYDAYSGLARSQTGGSTATNTLLTLANYITDDLTGYQTAYSSADTTVPSATSVWEFTSFSFAQITALYDAGSNAVRMTLRDADSDRDADMEAVTNMLFGYLRLTDDDSARPVLSGFNIPGADRTNTSLRPGDIAIVGYQSDNPDRFAVVALADILEGAVIYFTENGWSNSPPAFRTGEATLTWTAPAGGVAAGTVVEFTNVSAAAYGVTVGSVSKSGTWDLSTGGDTILAYQNSGNPQFLYGLSISASGWTAGDVTTANSQLPSNLTSGVTAWVPSSDTPQNGYYSGTQSGDGSSLLAAIVAAANWTTNDAEQTWPTWSFTVGGPIVYVDMTDNMPGDGFSITGLVQDAGSGLYRAGDFANSPTVTVYNSAGTAIAGAYFTTGPVSDGDGDSAPETLAVAGLTFTPDLGTIYTARVVVVDYDVDRTGDSLTSTQLIVMRITGDNDTNPPTAGTFEPGNLLQNSRFEWQHEGGSEQQPLYWTEDERSTFYANGGYWGTGSREAWRSYPDGAYCGAIRGTWSSAGTDGGLWQQVTNEMGEGTVWEASAWVWSDADVGTTWTSEWRAIFVEFWDAGSSNIITRSTNLFETPGMTWTKVAVTAAAPAGAMFARWVIGAWGVGDEGALSIDDACLRVVTNVAMDFAIGNQSFYRSGTGTNLTFRVTDGDLYSVSATNLMKFVFNVYDPSGLQRDSGSELLNYDISAELELQNIFSTYNASMSSADTTIGGSTSVFAHATRYSLTTDSGSQTGMVWALMGWQDGGGTNRISLSAPDADLDRAGDDTWLVDARFGDLIVADDDVDGPHHWLHYIGTNVASGSYNTNPITDADMLNFEFAYGIWDASGILVTNHLSGSTNADGNLGEIAVNWDLVTPAGVDLITDAVPSAGQIHSPFGNRSYNATVVVDSVSAVTYNVNTIGVWRVQGSAQDMDWDRGTYLRTNASAGVETISWDRAWSSDWRMDFTVYDDDSSAPIHSEFTAAGEGGFETNIPAGGIAIIGVNGGPNTTLERFSFVVLRPFAAGTVIEFTDCGWSNSSEHGWGRITEFHTNRWVATGDADVGEVFELALTNINSGGDQVAVYQYHGAGLPTNEPWNVDFVYAINMEPNGESDGWDVLPVSTNDNNHSALYYGLVDGQTAVSIPNAGSVNVRYTGETVGVVSDLLQWIGDPNNWEVQPNLTDMDITNYTFTITGDGTIDWTTPIITDAEMRTGGWWVTNIVEDLLSGLLASNSTFGSRPWFGLYTPAGTLVMSNAYAVNFPNGAMGQQTLTLEAPGLGYSDVVLGYYTGTTSIADFDNDRIGDAAYGITNMRISVIDDDSAPPLVTSNASTAPLGVWIGTSNVVGSTTDTNAIFVVTDGDLASIGATNYLSNGDFEKGLTGWQGGGTFNELAAAEGGTNGISMGGWTNAQPSLFADAASAPGDVFDVSIRVRKEPFWAIASGGVLDFKVEFKNGVGGDLGATAVTNIAASITTNWQTFTIRSQTAPAGTAYVRPVLIAWPGCDPTSNDNYDVHTDNWSVKRTDASPFRLILSAYDADNGLSRGTTDPSTQMNVSVGSIFVSNVANYIEGESTADSRSTDTTNTWKWQSFNPGDITEYIEVGDAIVRATVFDADDDRANDRMILSNQQFGILRFRDDDTNAPALPSVTATNSHFRVYVGGVLRSATSGTSTNRIWDITEGDLGNLAANPLEFHFMPYDASGIYRNDVGPETNMNISVANFTTNNVGNYEASLSSSFADTRVSGASSVWSFATSYGYAELGTLFGTTGWISKIYANIPDADADRPDDQLWITNQQYGFMRLVDDDDAAPAISAIYSASNFVATLRELHVTLNTNDQYLSGSSTNRLYRVTDGNLANLSSTNVLRFTFGVNDTAGIFRDAGETDTNAAMNVSVGAVITNNFANFFLSESSPDPAAGVSTNVWRFSSAFSTAEIDAFYAVPSNTVRATIPDRDDDRANDSMTRYNQQYGHLSVIDDDSTAPSLAAFAIPELIAGGSVVADLFFSEYVEGSSNDKALEIYNGTGADIDFSTSPYYVMMYANGSTNAGIVVPLQGVITNGKTWVITQTSASSTLSNLANQIYGIGWFNGDDAIVLRKNATNGPVVDCIGQVGNDPGTAWTSGSLSTLDQTLRRKSTIDEGNTNYLGAFESLLGSEWDGYPQDNFDDLGQHTFAGGGSTYLTDQYIRDGGYTLTGQVQDADSGIYATGGNAPAFSLYNSAGTALELATAFDNGPVANGDARVAAEALWHVLSGAAYADVTLGTYTAVVVATDYDFDRTADSLTTTSTYTFVVADDDTNAPAFGISGVTNLLRNNDFEIDGTTDYAAWGWEWGNPDANAGVWGNTIHPDTWPQARSGTRLGAIPGLWGWDPITNNAGGWWQQASNGWAVGTVWEAGAWVWNDDGTEGGAVWTSSARGLKIEFYDVNGAALPAADNANLFEAPGETWTWVSVLATSPANAVWARFVIYADGVSTEMDSGALQFDDVMLRPLVPFGVQMGNRYIRPDYNDNTTNAFYTINDRDIGTIGATNPLKLVFGVYDGSAGLSRGTDNASTQMNVSVLNLAANDVAHYSATESMAFGGTVSNDAYSVWRWESITAGQMQDMINAGSNLVTATIYDADDDRSGDRMSLTSQRFGFLRVTDNDVAVPAASNLQVNWADPSVTNVTDQQLHIGSWGLQLSFYDVSGIVTNEAYGFLPNYSLFNPVGTLVISNYGWENIFTPDGMNYTMWKTWAGAVEYTNIMTGTHTLVWSAQDMDRDRDGDQQAVTNSHNIAVSSNLFMVVDDDVTQPTAPADIVITPSWWTNVNYFVVNFSPATDASGIGQYRASTNASPPTAVTDGYLLSGTMVTNLQPAVISNAGFEVGAEGLEVTGWPVYTNDWRSIGTPTYARANWSGTYSQEGTFSMRHTVDAGGTEARYTIVGQEVRIYNTNQWPVRASFQAYFRGDMSHSAWGDYGGAFMKMELLDENSNILQSVANEYNTDHNGRPLFGVNAATWVRTVITVTNGLANTEYIRVITGINNFGTRLAFTGYWDSLSLTVTVEQLDINTGVVFTNAAQGSNTVWLFAVDDDDDRLNDRLKSPNTNFVAYLDQIPPPQIDGMSAAAGFDDATEVILTWNPLSDHTIAGGGTNLSPWYSYVIFYNMTNPPTTNDPSFSWEDGYATLATNTTGTITLSNGVPGDSMQYAIAGRDRAGNLGPISDPITNIFTGFYMTQGLLRAEGYPELFWSAATNESGDIVRQYDLIYCDAVNFTEALTNEWKLLSTGYTNSMVDMGGSGRVAPWDLINTMRFYRAAAVDRWLSNRTPRIASAEIYGAKTFRLYRGQNWVALPFIPDSNAAIRVFGAGLAGGPDLASATAISWYHRDPAQTAKTEIWLDNAGSSNVWRYSKPDILQNEVANLAEVPIYEGFIVTVRPTAPEPQVVTFVGRVPTNEIVQPIGALRKYNLAGFTSPRWVHPSQMNLLESGFKGANFPINSDRIWAFNRVTQTAKADIWYNSTDGTWRYNITPNFPIVQSWERPFGPDDAFVILTSPTNTLYWAWTNKVLYTPPTRTMTP